LGSLSVGQFLKIDLHHAQNKTNANMVQAVDETKRFISAATFPCGLRCGQPDGAAGNNGL
jgi:hypothetical protein